MSSLFMPRRKGVHSTVMIQNTQELFQDFILVIEDLAVLSEKIAQMEEAKAEAASLKRHELLDDYMQEEQAQILKLRGLEQRRIRLTQALGWDSLTFRQILEQAQPDQVRQLSPCFEELEQQLKRLQQSRKAAEQIINVRIHELQVAIAEQEGSGYDNAGNISLDSPYRSKMRNTYV